MPLIECILLFVAHYQNIFFMAFTKPIALPKPY